MHHKSYRQWVCLSCIMLIMMLCFFGCNKKQDTNSEQPAGFAIDKPFNKGPLHVQMRLNDDHVKLSGLLELELSATIDPNYTIEFPAVAETLKQFKVYSFKDLPDGLTDDGKVIKTYQYQLEPLEQGQCEIPAFTFNFKRKGESQEEKTKSTLTTEPVEVAVTSTLAADANALTIADIEDVVEMKTSYTWLWISLGCGLLVVAGICIGRIFKSKKQIQKQRIYKPAHEIAFEVLKAIAGEKLVEQGRVKEFYEKLSVCLRQYIENRFQLRAPEQTTEEFLEQLKTSDALRLEHKQELQKFLEHCDLVKFARYQPSDEQINESLTMAEKFVEKTKSQQHVVDVTDISQTEGEVVS